MGQNGIAAVYDAGVIAALVEHAHVEPQHIGQIDRAGHAALVRADDQHMVAVHLQPRGVLQKSLDELVGRGDGLKAVKGNRVLDAGIVGLEGNDVFHAHVHQLLQSHGAVEGFPGAALVLAAFIQIGHDNRQTAGLAADSRDDALQILEMIVGRHVVRVAVKLVGQAVIADIHHQVQIVSADGIVDGALGLSGSEPGRVRRDQIRVALISGEGDIGFVLQIAAVAPFYKVIVDLAAEVLAAFQWDQSERTDRNGFQYALASLQ